MDTTMCVAETETISYIPIQNEKFLKSFRSLFLYMVSAYRGVFDRPLDNDAILFSLGNGHPFCP